MVHSRLAKGKSSNHIGFQNSSPYSRVSIAFTRQVSKFQLHSAVAPTVPRRNLVRMIQLPHFTVPISGRS